MKMHEDQKYVRGFQSGDTTLINKLCKELYTDNYEKIIQMVVNNSGTREDGEDIFQRAILAIYSKAKSDPNFVLTAKISTYLYQVSFNLWLNVLRERVKVKLTILDESVLNNEQHIIDEIVDHDIKAQQSILFHEKFQLLNKNYQTMLSAFFEGKAMNEVAEITGKQSNSLRTIKSKCIKTLKEMIVEDASFKNLSERT
jgi:RNA polymerase sigma factor (sigma-70 family)